MLYFACALWRFSLRNTAGCVLKQKDSAYRNGVCPEKMAPHGAIFLP
nr:MAG TPA: hypothetical protein [Caudoviricetes sp.]